MTEIDNQTGPMPDWVPAPPVGSVPVIQPVDPNRTAKIVAAIVGTVVLLAAVIVAIVVGQQQAGPGKFDVHGEMVLDSEGAYGLGGVCTGVGGYEDMGSTAQVSIYDNAGTMLANSNLNMGEPDQFGNCVFSFLVKDVPVADTDLYSVEVSHRGKITFTKDEADDLGLTLG